MFRRGRGGSAGREGRRPWCLLGHARVARMLLVYAVANFTRTSTCTATDVVINTPRSCGLHGHYQPPSISPHHLRSPRSCLRPSRSAAAPELPVQEVAGLHRTCTVVTPTSTPGQREDVQTGASILIHSHTTEQRVKHCGVFVVLPAHRDSANGHSVTTLRSTRLPQKHRRCRCAYAAGTHQLPLIDRDVTRVSARDLPCLKQPLLALDTRDTGGWCYIASSLLRCAQFERATRFGQGQGVVGPTSATSVLSACEGSLPFGGQVTTKANAARRTLTSHTRPPAPPLCTSTAATSVSYWSSYFAYLPLLRPAALGAAVAEDWRGHLPLQVLRYLDRHYQSSLLHCTHFCTGCRQRLSSWAPTATSKYFRLGTLHTTPRPRHGGFTALHKRTTATPKHGSTSGSPHCCCRITSG